MLMIKMHIMPNNGTELTIKPYDCFRRCLLTVGAIVILVFGIWLHGKNCYAISEGPIDDAMSDLLNDPSNLHDAAIVKYAIFASHEISPSDKANLCLRFADSLTRVRPGTPQWYSIMSVNAFAEMHSSFEEREKGYKDYKTLFSSYLLDPRKDSSMIVHISVNDFITCQVEPYGADNFDEASAEPLVISCYKLAVMNNYDDTLLVPWSAAITATDTGDTCLSIINKDSVSADASQAAFTQATLRALVMENDEPKEAIADLISIEGTIPVDNVRLQRAYYNLLASLYSKTGQESEVPTLLEKQITTNTVGSSILLQCYLTAKDWTAAKNLVDALVQQTDSRADLDDCAKALLLSVNSDPAHANTAYDEIEQIIVPELSRLTNSDDPTEIMVARRLLAVAYIEQKSFDKARSLLALNMSNSTPNGASVIEKQLANNLLMQIDFEEK